MNWLTGVETILKAISDVLTAGVAVITFSLFISAVTFKVRDAVTNTFTLLLFCLVVIFGADAFITVIKNTALLVSVIKVHLLGLILLPTAYFLFSDVLLSLTGKPSRGKRKALGILSVLISVIFLVLLFSDLLLGSLVVGQQPAPYFERTLYIDIFTLFFAGILVLSWLNFVRTLQRTVTQASRRRMVYLIVSAIGPAVGSFPFLFYGSKYAAQSSIIFWLFSVFANVMVAFGVVAMTYSVSFYGFHWTDRVIKSRLFRWVMRGPIAASLTLGVTTLISRIGTQININVSAIATLGMVATIVIFEYAITMFAPVWERLFFYGDDRIELEKIRTLEDRLLTSNDIRQFLELILASVCDRLQVHSAGLIINSHANEKLDVYTGNQKPLTNERKLEIFEFLERNTAGKLTVAYKELTLIPIIKQIADGNSSPLLGVIVINQLVTPTEELIKPAIEKLTSRAAMALSDRVEQEQLFTSLEMLAPQVSVIQGLLASSRISQRKMVNGDEEIQLSDLEGWVKDALSQIWGGPKVLQNPILQLKWIQNHIRSSKESPLNAVRELLRGAIVQLKPEGERQYTNEWMLFNLMDLKYLEGWKVKDIAIRLSISEADLYRKQRMAITAISRQIIEIEKAEDQ